MLSLFLDAVKMLKINKCDALKIASPEIKNIPLIEECLKTNLPIIISTGYCEKKDIDRAYSLINEHKKNHLGYCTVYQNIQRKLEIQI